MDTRERSVLGMVLGAVVSIALVLGCTTDSEPESSAEARACHLFARAVDEVTVGLVSGERSQYALTVRIYKDLGVASRWLEEGTGLEVAMRDLWFQLWRLDRQDYDTSFGRVVSSARQVKRLCEDKAYDVPGSPDVLAEYTCLRFGSRC